MSKKISIILPCRNERESIKEVLIKTKEAAKKNNLDYEIIVSDSSSDGSDKIAESLNVKVIKHNLEGYGFALLEGFKHAQGEIIIFFDSDGTYNPEEIPKLIENINGADIVIGSRLKGKIEKKAMPFSHRFFGTPFLNFLLFLFFGINVSDSQSGFRAIKKSALNNLNLQTTGMEFATEMLIKAKKSKIKLKEVPITYSIRKGNSKLRPYYDGLQHLRYIVLQIPIYFYLIPACILFFSGILGLLNNILNLKLPFFFNTATNKFIFPILGAEIFFGGLFAKTFLISKFNEKSVFAEKLNSFLKFKNVLRLALILIGIPFILKITHLDKNNFEPLFISTILGFLILFNTFILSIINTINKNK